MSFAELNSKDRQVAASDVNGFRSDFANKIIQKLLTEELAPWLLQFSQDVLIRVELLIAFDTEATPAAINMENRNITCEFWH